MEMLRTTRALVIRSLSYWRIITSASPACIPDSLYATSIVDLGTLRPPARFRGMTTASPRRNNIRTMSRGTRSHRSPVTRIAVFVCKMAFGTFVSA